MYSSPVQPHYSPTSVGGLMDPVFLRRAVNDADSIGHADVPRAPARWRVALSTTLASWGHRLAKLVFRRADPARQPAQPR